MRRTEHTYAATLTTVLVTLAASVMMSRPARGADRLILVQDGQSRAPIVLFENAPRFTRLAAEELAAYIAKSTGVRPKVIEGAPDPIPTHAIWVGYQPMLKQLFPDVDFEFKHPEEILIAANANHLVIAGRDRWDPVNNILRMSRGRTMEGIQREYGTANAVYTFLQDKLGVRWLWPGDSGEDVPERGSIAFAPFEYRYHPTFRGRRGLFTRWRLNRNGFRGGGSAQSWVRYQRLLFDSLEIPGGHGFGNWWERFHDTHPEYFALQPDGTRSAFPSKKNVKMCHSNPALVEQWLADVEAQIARDPTLTVFNASPNDGYTAGHCICKNCLALDQQEAEILHFTWQGLAQKYVALTDRHITFANRCGRLLRERYPDRDYFVYMLGYGNWRPPPVEAVPDDNVLIGSVCNFHLRDDPAGRERFLAWAKIAPNLSWRPNLGFGIRQVGLPMSGPAEAAADLRLAANSNVIGLFFDTIWGHWATRAPYYYVLAQLAWNPYADHEAILDDWYRRAFGPAAADVRAYWDLVAANTRTYAYDPDTAWPDLFGPEFLQRAAGHLDRAAAAAVGAPEQYAERVAFIRAGLTFTDLYMQARELMLRHRPDNGDSEAQEKARQIWMGEIYPLLRTYPFALNEAFAGPQAGRALRELYPDNLREEWMAR